MSSEELLWFQDLESEDVLTTSGVSKEERNAKYFKDLSREEDAIFLQESKQKLRVLERKWFLDEKLQDNEEVEIARKDWMYYIGQSVEFRDRSKRKERRKNGKVTLNIIDYGIRDANARSAIREGKYEKALDFLKDMQSRKKDEPNVWLMMGKCYLHLNDEKSMHFE
jgi:pentatricopeptide repeat protein